MRRLKAAVTALVLAGIGPVAPVFALQERVENVELELMTWPELNEAIQRKGKTVALVYNGGTEQRGPHGALGAHSLMGRETVKAIALQLGNAIAAPVLPFSPNYDTGKIPGTIGLSALAYKLVNQNLAEQLIRSGFRTVVLMGDHFEGQQELAALATLLERRYASRGIHVFYCGDVYTKAGDTFAAWLKANGYPLSGHGGIADTSELLYLGGDKGWVRTDLVATAVGDSIRAPGHWHDGNAKPINNGIMGDARRSSASLGKQLFDLKVSYGVAQINRMLRSVRKSRES